MAILEALLSESYKVNYCLYCVTVSTYQMESIPCDTCIPLGICTLKWLDVRYNYLCLMMLILGWFNVNYFWDNWSTIQTYCSWFSGIDWSCQNRQIADSIYVLVMQINFKTVKWFISRWSSWEKELVSNMISWPIVDLSIPYVYNVFNCSGNL